MKNLKSKLMIVTGSSVLAISSVSACAEGTSLLTAEVTTVISGFAANIVPTALGVVSIVVPVGLTLWAIGFGVKKGISFLQKKASKAI